LLLAWPASTWLTQPGTHRVPYSMAADVVVVGTNSAQAWQGRGRVPYRGTSCTPPMEMW